MTPTLHPSQHRVDTFLVNEPLLPWSLRESVWARGMAHPQVVGSDHLPVRLALPGLLSAAGRAAMPTPVSAASPICSDFQTFCPDWLHFGHFLCFGGIAASQLSHRIFPIYF